MSVKDEAHSVSEHRLNAYTRACQIDAPHLSGGREPKGARLKLQADNVTHAELRTNHHRAAVVEAQHIALVWREHRRAASLDMKRKTHLGRSRRRSECERKRQKRSERERGFPPTQDLGSDHVGS